MADKTWIALRRQKVAGEFRDRGDEVPEAADWPRRQVWIDAGYVEEVNQKDAAKRQVELVVEAEQARQRKEADIAARRTAEGEDAETPPRPAPIRLSRLKKDELRELARDHGIAFTESNTKEELVERLEAHGIGREE